MRGLGAFVGGLATGYSAGARLDMERERAARDEELHGLRVKDAKIELKRKEDDEALRREMEEAGRAAFQQSLTGNMIANDDEGNPLPPANKNPFGERGAMIDGADAMAAAALRRGRQDIALQHLQGAAVMRAKLRSEHADDAIRRLSIGDPSGVFNFYNYLVPDGGKVDAKSFKESLNDKGEKVYNVEVDVGGRRVPQSFTLDQLKAKVMELADPQKSLAADLQMQRAKLLEQWKWDNSPETRKGGFKERELEEKVRHNQAAEGLRGEEIEALRDYRRATLALRSTAADRRGTLTPKDVNNLVERGGLAFRKLLDSEQSKEDAKINPNAMMSLLPAMQSELGAQIRDGADPEVALEKTYYKYRDLVGALNDNLTEAVRRANEGWGGDKTKKLTANLARIMEENGFSKAEMKRLAGATKAGSSNPAVLRAIDALPEPTRQIRGAPGLEPKPGATPAPAGRSRADAFFTN